MQMLSCTWCSSFPDHAGMHMSQHACGRFATRHSTGPYRVIKHLVTGLHGVCSYRGYGRSTGTPSEQGLKQDAQAALDYLLSRKQGKGKVRHPASKSLRPCSCFLTVLSVYHQPRSKVVFPGESLRRA